MYFLVVPIVAAELVCSCLPDHLDAVVYAKNQNKKTYAYSSSSSYLQDYNNYSIRH